MPAQGALARLKAMAPYRAWTRFTESSGNLLAAGVSYYAFFSIFPALALAFAIFGFVLQGRPISSLTLRTRSTAPSRG